MLITESSVAMFDLGSNSHFVPHSGGGRGGGGGEGAGNGGRPNFFTC